MARYNWVYKDTRYKKAREIVLQRDGGLCQKCKQAVGTECHHKIPLDDITADRNNPNLFICFSPDNMEMLCLDCHNRIDTKICADDVIITEDGEVIGL
jgi:5-methylcytosine-specific restriction endonuclease McrA